MKTLQDCMREARLVIAEMKHEIAGRKLSAFIEANKHLWADIDKPKDPS